MSADGAPAPEVTLVVTSVLVDSPWEPPGRPDRGVDELAASIRELGVIEPLIVREKGERIEIVDGHRRRRAAQKAGLSHVPCIKREITDLEAREIMLVANVQRLDITPLEEADELGRMQAELGRSPEQIAGRIGKSTSHVYRRLALLRLTAECRRALEEARVVAVVAEQLAAIHDAEAQDKLLGELTAPWRHSEPATAREAKQVIRSNYRLRLVGAPFALDDAQIVPAAGSCTKCPKRTGAQMLLLGEVDDDDRCMDAECFEAKKDAAWTIEKARAVDAGVRVIEGAEAKKLYPHDFAGLQSAALVDLDDAFPCDPEPEDERDDDGKQIEPLPARSWREKLGDHAKAAAVVRTASGAVHHLMPAKEAARALKAAGHAKEAKELERRAQDEEKRAESAGPGKPAPAARRDLESKAEELAIAEALEAIVAKAERKKVLNEGVWRHVVALLATGMDDLAIDELCVRRGLLLPLPEDKAGRRGDQARDAVRELAKDASLGVLFGLVEEFAIRADLNFPPHSNVEVMTPFDLALRFADVDFEQLKKDALKKVRAEEAAAKKAKEKPAKAAPKKSSSSKASAAEPAIVPCAGCGSSAHINDVRGSCPYGRKQDAPRFAAGQRVKINGGPGGSHNGRVGVIDKLCKKPFADQAYVLLDRLDKERTAKRQMIALVHLEPEEEEVTDSNRFDGAPIPAPAKVIKSVLDFACGKCGAAPTQGCANERGLPAKPHAVRLAALARAEGKEPIPEAPEPTCRVCGCTEDKACVGPQGDPCSWSDAAETLCSECAGIMQEIEERLANGARSELVVIGEIEEASDAEHVDEKLILKAIGDLIRENKIQRIPGGMLALQLKLPVVVKKTPAQIEREILELLKAEPELSSVVLLTRLDCSRGELDAAITRLSYASLVRSRVKSGVTVWISAATAPSPPTSAEAPAKRGRGRPPGSKNKPKAAK